jgi:hypothetical protein
MLTEESGCHGDSGSFRVAKFQQLYKNCHVFQKFRNPPVLENLGIFKTL